MDRSHVCQDVDIILPDLVSGWCDWPVQQIQYKQQSRVIGNVEMALSKLNPWGFGFTLCHQPLLLGEGISLLIGLSMSDFLRIRVPIVIDDRRRAWEFEAREVVR